MSGLMGGAVRLISLRFAFSNSKIIPECVREKISTRLPSSFLQEQPNVQGVMFLDPVEKVGCLPFLRDLKGRDYILVDSFYEAKKRTHGKEYFLVRFDFASLDYAYTDDRFDREQRPKLEKALYNLFRESMWRVRAFLNPFYEEGQILENQCAISINLEARYPLFDKFGQRCREWEKDEFGQPTGDAPVKVHPKLFLRIKKGDIKIAHSKWLEL